jgi:integrase-like protein
MNEPAASESPNRSLWPSASTSTRTSSSGFSESISRLRRGPEVRHGFPSLVTPKTRCGHWICFDVNRHYYELTGFWWSWIISRDGLSVLPFTAVLWMALQYAACSTEQFIRRHRRSVSVPIMIPFIGSISGKQICGSWRSRKIKTVPYIPLSHPFVDRLIGTICREYLDQTLFWTAADLDEKLRIFHHYFNRHRTHSGLEGRLPESDQVQPTLTFASYRWQKHCRGLYQTPMAA